MSQLWKIVCIVQCQDSHVLGYELKRQSECRFFTTEELKVSLYMKKLKCSNGKITEDFQLILEHPLPYREMSESVKGKPKNKSILIKF